ncbi:hypothetical protein DFH06DRAFT_50523 [Mycena polygramma]|nr:hypothetical protein DFH06DRAFT_50523 [Mycena polygramma]
MSGRNPMPILVCVGLECLRDKATGSSCPTCLAQNIGNVFSTSVSGQNSRRRRGTVSRCVLVALPDQSDTKPLRQLFRVFAAHSTMVLRILLSGFRMRSAVQNCASFRHLMPERYQRRSGAGGLILSSHGAQCTVMQLRARTRSDKIAEMYSPRSSCRAWRTVPTVDVRHAHNPTLLPRSMNARHAHSLAQTTRQRCAESCLPALADSAHAKDEHAHAHTLSFTQRSPSASPVAQRL